MKTLFAFFAALVVTFTPPAKAGTVTLDWDAYPTPGEITAIVIKVKYADGPAGPAATFTTVGSFLPTATTGTMTNLQPGAATFVAVAVASGAESGESNAVTVTIPKALKLRVKIAFLQSADGVGWSPLGTPVFTTFETVADRQQYRGEIEFSPVE